MGRFRKLAALVLLLAPPSFPRHGKRNRAPDSVTVQPSEAIEARVAEEVGRAQAILQHLDIDNMFDSPYLVSAIYYHDGFLSAYPADRGDLDPSGRIVAQISRRLAPEEKCEYIRLLAGLYESNPPETNGRQLVLPAPEAEPGRRRRRRQPHQYAIDLFAPEGTPVRSVERGIVALAEGGWTQDDPFSTSSLRGGNAVIVFSPDTRRFYRYCHLEAVSVIAGMLVTPGEQIGAIGHSGFNASRGGHGRHLHFEVNEFDGRTVRALNKNQLQAFLRAIANQTDRPAAGASFRAFTSKRSSKPQP